MHLFKLGKLAPKNDKRTLRLSRYLPFGLQPPPESVDWTSKVAPPWGAMLNDSLGDCTCAAAGHMIQTWTANATAQVNLPDQAILDAYSAVSGYNPITGQNDAGAVVLDVMKYWRWTGIGEHKIGAFAAVSLRTLNGVKNAVNLFGGAYLGVALPASAQSQVGQLWTMPDPDDPGGNPGSWGGHAISIVSYDTSGLTCVTWGQTQRMDWKFFLAYCDEAYALISPDFLNGKGLTPAGFNLDQLRKDLEAVSA